MGLKRKVADAVGRALGVSIAPAGGADARAEELFVRALFDALAIDCVFDVGANVGQYGHSLRALGYAGRILSFEPGPQMVAALAQAAADDPLWEVLPVALGEADGRLALNIMTADVMSSFLQPDTGEGAAYDAINRVERVVDVEVRALAGWYDELRSRYGFERPFLKLDTQGFDLHVVRGAGARLAAFSGVLSEMAVRRLYAGSPHMIESLSAFAERGFDLAGIYKVHASELLDPYEFNCYLLRRDLARRPGDRAT